MSGELPSSPGFAITELESSDPTLKTTAHSGKDKTRKFGGHKWMFSAQYDVLTKEEFRPIWAFLLSQRGEWDSFTVKPTEFATPLGAGGGTPAVAGASQTGYSMDIDGCPLSTTGWLKAGDPFTLANQSKVYVLTSDADTDGTGAVTLEFIPELIDSPADGELLTITDIAFTMRQRGKVQKYRLRSGLFRHEVDLIEAL